MVVNIQQTLEQSLKKTFKNHNQCDEKRKWNYIKCSNKTTKGRKKEQKIKAKIQGNIKNTNKYGRY